MFGHAFPATVRDAREQPLRDLGGAKRPVEQAKLCRLAHELGDGGNLLRLDELLDKPEVCRALANLHALATKRAGPRPPFVACRSNAAGRLRGRQRKARGRRSAAYPHVLAGRAGALRDVVRLVAVHLHDRVGDGEERPRAARHDDRAYACPFPEVAHSLDKRRDGLVVGVHDGLHELVAHHEVGGRGVLVYEQDAASGERGLDGPGGLGGAAACVVGREGAGVRPARKVADEQRDVRGPHGASVLGAELDGAGVGDDKFAAIARNMVVDALLQGPEQRRLAVVAASYDERDASADCHAARGAPMRQVKRHGK